MRLKNVSFSFSALLLAIGALFVIMPLAHNSDMLNVLLRISFSAIIFFSIYAVAETRVYFIVAIIITIPNLVIRWYDYYDNMLCAQAIALVSSIILYSYIALLSLKYIFRIKKVDNNVLYGAVLVYMLMGLIWASAYSLIELLSPGSFTGLLSPNLSLTLNERINFHMEQLLYYSYVTLTTLGYGNIAPSSVAASATASAEAIVGQLYLTILIARFVGLHIVESISSKENK